LSHPERPVTLLPSYLVGENPILRAEDVSSPEAAPPEKNDPASLFKNLADRVDFAIAQDAPVARRIFLCLFSLVGVGLVLLAVGYFTGVHETYLAGLALEGLIVWPVKVMNRMRARDKALRILTSLIPTVDTKEQKSHVRALVKALIRMVNNE
jgi:hypothetical protein